MVEKRFLQRKSVRQEVVIQNVLVKKFIENGFVKIILSKKKSKITLVLLDDFNIDLIKYVTNSGSGELYDQ